MKFIPLIAVILLYYSCKKEESVVKATLNLVWTAPLGGLTIPPILHKDNVYFTNREDRGTMYIVGYNNNIGSKLFESFVTPPKSYTLSAYNYANLMAFSTAGGKSYIVDLDNKAALKWSDATNGNGIIGIGKTIFVGVGTDYIPSGVGFYSKQNMMMTDITQVNLQLVYADSIQRNTSFPAPNTPTVVTDILGDTLLYRSSQYYSTASNSFQSVYSNLICYNLTRKRKVFEVKFDSLLTGFTQFVGDGKVFCIFGNDLYCFDAKNGQVIWHRPTSLFSNFIYEDGRIYSCGPISDRMDSLV